MPDKMGFGSIIRVAESSTRTSPAFFSAVFVRIADWECVSSAAWESVPILSLRPRHNRDTDNSVVSAPNPAYPSLRKHDTMIMKHPTVAMRYIYMCMCMCIYVHLYVDLDFKNSHTGRWSRSGNIFFLNIIISRDQCSSHTIIYVSQPQSRDTSNAPGIRPDAMDVLPTVYGRRRDGSAVGQVGAWNTERVSQGWNTKMRQGRAAETCDAEPSRAS